MQLHQWGTHSVQCWVSGAQVRIRLKVYVVPLSKVMPQPVQSGFSDQHWLSHWIQSGKLHGKPAGLGRGRGHSTGLLCPTPHSAHPHPEKPPLHFPPTLHLLSPSPCTILHFSLPGAATLEAALRSLPRSCHSPGAACARSANVLDGTFATLRCISSG